jgi:transmembrane sensor
LVGVAASAVLVAVILLWQAAPKQTQTWQTAPGEQRAITLADGTRITLNTRSSLEARLSPSAREVRLLRGEAFFDVAKDAKRPFVVATALGKARVMGTRFDVLFEAERVEVATQTGSVLVSSLDGRAPDVLASAGLRATIVRGGAGPTLGRADLARIENWRAQRLEFDRVPLEEALREFSRYTARPIKAATPEIGQIRVSAVLRTGDVDALRATLQAAFGLTILEGRDASLVSAAPRNER